MFEESLRTSDESPISLGTHSTFFSDEEDEERKVDDEEPLLSSDAVTSSEKLKPRKRGKLPTFRRKRRTPVTKPAQQPQQKTDQVTVPPSSTASVSTSSQSSAVRETSVTSTAGHAKTGPSKPRTILGEFSRRFSFPRRERRAPLSRKDRKDSNEVTSKGEEREEEDDPQVMEQDPIIQIFESRNKQRVRFALEGHDEPTKSQVPETKKENAIEALSEDGKTSGANIKQFMSRALFGTSKSSAKLNEEMKAEVANLGGSLVWESSAEMSTGPEVVHTKTNSACSELVLSFTEDPVVRVKVERLLEKARKAEHQHFRYEYGVKCYLKVLSLLKEATYPDDHPTVVRTIDMLTNAHHVLSSYNNSANIVKMGIKYEDSGELVRALKMYTIAYRIRRDNLSRNHPSLVVLLNMLGSIQIKRGELQEAMQIYELALMDSPAGFSDGTKEDEFEKPPSNLLAKSVTYREMGVIYERWGKIEDALNIYHKSLECVTEWKEAVHKEAHATMETDSSKPASSRDYSISDVRLTKAVSDRRGSDANGEMEAVIGSKKNTSPFGVTKSDRNMYESYFPADLETEFEKKKPSPSSGSGPLKTRQDTHADMDLALTLFQIAQLHRSQGEFARALDAYVIALRGMKHALGKHHPNVAAVLGNIGNLQKEMGDMDAAYKTYEEVLGIESYRLGLNHPDVAITLHNIATIDAARGNYDHALKLYRKVIELERRLFGNEHISVAVAAACMGDVYEKTGQYTKAVESYEEAVRIKSLCLGRHSVDVARLLHRLGKLAFLAEDFQMAESFVSRALLMYRLNKVDEEHAWMVDANRDAADIDAALAMGRGGSGGGSSSGRQFEC